MRPNNFFEHLRYTFNERRCVCAFFLLVFVTLALPSASAFAAPTDTVAHHIQSVKDRIVPPVLVQGEANRTTTLAERMAALHVRGVSIAVIHNGKLEWARGFGVTKIGGPRVTPNTLFQAASISKPITAIAALRLVQQERLDLDTDVNRYLKEWQIPSDHFTLQQKVTLRGLLTHTAGTTVHGFAGYAKGLPLPTVREILDGYPPANSPAIRVDIPPGTAWRYSGGGYVIVQKLLEDLTGNSFEKVMQTTVLDRIGMTRSTFAQPLAQRRLTEAALPFDSNGHLIEGGPHAYPEKAAAGLWTTPTDLARYVVEVQQSLQNNSNRVLSPEMTQQMLRADANHQGLGPLVGGDSRRPYFEHGGANEGYQSLLVAYNSGDGAIVMTNSDNGYELAQDIVRTIAHEYHWPNFQPAMRSIASIDPARFDLLTGSYRLTPEHLLSITRKGDSLIAQVTGRPSREIFPESELIYFYKDINAQITFELDERGRAVRIVLQQDDQDTLAERID